MDPEISLGGGREGDLARRGVHHEPRNIRHYLRVRVRDRPRPRGVRDTVRTSRAREQRDPAEPPDLVAEPQRSQTEFLGTHDTETLREIPPRTNGPSIRVRTPLNEPLLFRELWMQALTQLQIRGVERHLTDTPAIHPAYLPGNDLRVIPPAPRPVVLPGPGHLSRPRPLPPRLRGAVNAAVRDTDGTLKPEPVAGLVLGVVTRVAWRLVSRCTGPRAIENGPLRTAGLPDPDSNPGCEEDNRCPAAARISGTAGNAGFKAYRSIRRYGVKPAESGTTRPLVLFFPEVNGPFTYAGSGHDGISRTV